ncbi:ERF family protein [Fructilactobacillus sp. Tb1]|uniref:ERF family protein n=1 Tax=Fructilactobacillus sp. Tb1 TaxID=3422304 RepID=UPI003D2A692F
MKFSEERKEIFKSLNDFRTKLKQPAKNATNPYFKNNYVNLTGVTKAIDDALDGTGLAFFQNSVPTEAQNVVGIQTIMTHSSGQYIEFDPFFVPVGGKHDAQAYGSAKTYASRYSLATAFGITDSVDDDGNASRNDNNYSNQQHRSAQGRQSNQQNSKQPVNNQKKENKQKTIEEIKNLNNEVKTKLSAYSKMIGFDAQTTGKMVYETNKIARKTTNVSEIKKIISYLDQNIEKELAKQKQGVGND